MQNRNTRPVELVCDDIRAGAKMVRYLKLHCRLPSYRKRGKADQHDNHELVQAMKNMTEGSLPMPELSHASGKSPHIIFLVYDSRSGSTLLSRELASRLVDVVVTPEIGFDSLLRRNIDALKPDDWPWLLDKLYEAHDFFNGTLPRAQAEKVVCPDGRWLSIREGLRALIRAMAQAQSESICKEPRAIVVKNGTTIKYWPALQKLLGDDFQLMFVFRDPRAVINSKLKTPRPYHPKETMAWGGPLLAAWQWQRYSRLARQAAQNGVKVIEVRYEELMQDTAGELQRIAAAIGVDVTDVPRIGAYRIPDAERGIHSLVEKGGIEADRVEAWTKELLPADAKVIEASTEAEMRLRGYALSNKFHNFDRAFTILKRLPEVIISVVRHRLYMRGRVLEQARAIETKRSSRVQL